MASEKGHLAATETPLATPAPSQQQLAAASSAPEAPPTATSAADAAYALAAEISRTKSLKRSREETPPSPDSVESSSPGDLSPSKIARLVGFARSPPPSLNGTADHHHDEERRRRDEEHHAESVAASENLTHSPLADLMSGAPSGLARPPDAPSAPPLTSLDAAADAAARALSAVTIPAPSAVPNELKDVNQQPSAPSAASLANASGEVVNSPVPMEVDSREDQRLYAPQPDAQMEPQDKPPSSLSYPGVLPHGAPMSAPAAPPRGMSMPIPNAQGADGGPRSPGSKKHKCPYCSTEFTRHHNLKSHLLTHSQEKPYVCATCQMRFRRLHDLKRHSKLHTGEKPHICPKCDRKFARGDALARHSKGAGGCAGRRPSMGNFEDGEYDGVNPTGADETGLSNVMYEGSAEGGLAAEEEERRRLSLPAIKAQHVPGQTAPDGGYASHSSTYPPAGPRPTGLYPPNVDRGSAGPPASPSVPNNHTPHTSISTMPLSAAGTALYSQTGMTESPKPLSPGAAQPTALSHDALTRQRPPPVPQQSHFRPAEPTTSGLSLPSHGMSPAAEEAWRSQYPPADRDPSQGNTSAPASPATQQTAARGRSRASGGPPGPNRSGVVDGNNLFAAGDQGVWSYVQHMEDKFKQLQSMVEAASQNNAELTTKLNTHEQHISVLNQNSAELAAKVNAYEQHISSLNQTLTNLTAKCNNHEQHISVLTAEVSALRQQQHQQQHQQQQQPQPQQHPLHQHQQEHQHHENQQVSHQVHQLQQHQQEHQPEQQPSEHQPEQQHPAEPQPQSQPEPQPGHQQPGHQPEHQQQEHQQHHQPQQHQPEHAQQQQHVPTETQEPPPAAQQ